jgi:glyoxylase-like metal-dependent hydrolase (beta-lactamase superfamily II)
VGKVLDAAERLWNGESELSEEPWLSFLGLEGMTGDTAFVSSFGNVVAFATEEGAVVVDTGNPLTGGAMAASVREWLRERGHAERVNTIVLTHGHIDHVMGTKAFEAEGAARVVGHRALSERFDRYRLTRGYNAAINVRQFRLPGLEWPSDFRYPDVTYERSLALSVGGVRFELAHDRGETDDHTWVWVPERRALCTGDLFIWASPNCGNPQKVQRYPREWAVALRKMASLGAEWLFPGHGLPIVGADRVRRALEETAELLETLVEQTIAWMNEGAPLDVVVQRVRAPERLLARPYLRPVYDEPEFVVRNLWRLYGGWWDGDPSELKPAPKLALAREVAELCGGPSRMMARAAELSELGEHRVACHLAEMAARVEPDDEGLRAARATIYEARAKEETSLMAKSAFRAAAKELPARGFERD